MKRSILLLILCSAINVSHANAAPSLTADKATPSITIDKKAGTISVYYPETNKTITQPALLGKIKSNTLDMSKYDRPSKTDYITPAGTFKITKMFSWRLNEPMAVFIKGKSSVSAIHPVWMKNPNQRRVQRLLSPTPDDNRITGGCVNVDSKFFYSVINNLPDGTELTILPE